MIHQLPTLGREEVSPFIEKMHQPNETCVQARKVAKIRPEVNKPREDLVMQWAIPKS